jgi:hypothetical protein
MLGSILSSCSSLTKAVHFHPPMQLVMVLVLCRACDRCVSNDCHSASSFADLCGCKGSMFLDLLNGPDEYG